MNLTLATAKAIARAADSSANNAFSRVVFADPYFSYESHATLAAAEASEARADARREAVLRILRRKGFIVTVQPVGICTTVESP